MSGGTLLRTALPPSGAGAAATLELREVTKHYPGGVRALDGVSLRIDAGELAAIVGPSGSGKTTLLHVMSTLDRPTSGAVLVEGEDAATLPEGRLAGLRSQRIGFVFQQFFLIDGMSALENVATGLLYRGIPRHERIERAVASLERVRMGHRLHHPPAHLSGGERQRVAIARAVVGNPAIVFADEPTGNLDSKVGAEVMDLIRRLHGEGTTICVITHDRDIARSLPRRIAMRDGRVESDERGEAGR